MTDFKFDDIMLNSSSNFKCDNFSYVIDKELIEINMISAWEIQLFYSSFWSLSKYRALVKTNLFL